MASDRAPESKNVCVVGAGMSGLAAARELRREGHAVTVMEQSGDVGGQWAYDPRVDGGDPLGARAPVRVHGSLYASVRLLGPREAMGFSDFQFVAADVVVYCTGYVYSFPFLDTGGAVTVEDNRVGPLFEHTFPPALAPSLSFLGVPMRIFVPWFLEAQARWTARVLSGRTALPPEDDMLRAVREDYRAREMAGLPARYSHDIGLFKPSEIGRGFVRKYTDLPDMEDWKMELFLAAFGNMNDDRETFQDRDNYSESVREGFQRWLASAGAQYQAAIDAAGGGDAAHCRLHLTSEP
ncbi:flavin-containing monooxygenase FMO GS-OX-like 8 [Panicum miliaceum]|uniref:Flavin-containing monooxygenase n=1 Tax=Panicum miliaceum TaxID=4540 RepID=A0A3L6T725_PANMI|nr:flavin-containing monooxygenase FMO GS-OX-like 8 [Panicum miliaceum]